MVTLEARGSEFAVLSRGIKAVGLLDRRYGNYLLRIGVTLAAFAGVWLVFVRLGDSWSQLIVAAGLGLLGAPLRRPGARRAELRT